MSLTRRSDNDEQGFMAAEWMIGISLLLIPTFVLVYSLVQLPPRKNLTQVASAAAARAYVQALDQSQADAAARAAAAEAIASEKSVSEDDLEVEVKITNGPGYCPGSEVTAVVKLPLPVALDPFNGYRKVNSPTSLISSSATERIDDYAELADSETGTPGFVYDVDTPGKCPE